MVTEKKKQKTGSKCSRFYEISGSIFRKLFFYKLCKIETPHRIELFFSENMILSLCVKQGLKFYRALFHCLLLFSSEGRE